MSAALYQARNAAERLISRRRLRNAYRQVFGGLQGEEVLADLARECFADGRTTFQPNDPDGRISAFAEGRRYVFLHIMNTLNLTDAQLREKIAEEEPES